MKRFPTRHLLLLLLLGVIPAYGQFFYFGRNKVNYTDFDWHVLKTEHFDIYYYPEMKDLAECGARFAEESYGVLQEKFNHTVNARVPLIFYSSHLHFEQSNTTEGFIPEGVGGFFEFLKGRVVIPADGSIAEFRHVIRHELVHVFMTSKINRVLSDHRKVGDREPPLWFSEGLAEYWSATWDAQAEMVLRDMVLNGTVVGLSEMDRIYGTFLMYKEGQNALDFLSRTFGSEKILLLMENFWKETSFSDVFKITIGKDYREFDEMWLYELKKTYYPLLADYNAPSMSAINIVREGFNSKPVVYESDSARSVYFIGNRTGYMGIYRKNLDEKDPRAGAEEVVQGEHSDELESFHPFQSRIDVSRAGLLAFVTKSGEHDALHLMDVRSGEIVETFRFKDLVSIGSSSFSPSGDKIVFSAIDASGDNDLFVLTLRTRELQRLTNDVYDDRDPAWSPRGDVIAFSSDRGPSGRDGVYNLFLYQLSSGRIDYLTAGDASAGSPAFSKDGSRLAFTYEGDGVKNIWMMDVDRRYAGGMRSMTRLTRFTTSAFDPAWTTSGDLVFGTFERLSFQIKEIKNVQAIADTSRDIRLVDLYEKEKPWETSPLSGASELKRYRYQGDYSLDVAQSVITTDPVFGTRGGAVVALSDLLGNDQYYFLLYNTAEAQSDLLSSWNIAISRNSMGQRTNYAYGIYRFTGRRYDLTVSDDFFYERVYGGYFAMSYPLSKFERIETAVSLSDDNRDLLGGDGERRALLLSNAISFTHDNSLWGPSGPLDGTAFNLTLAYTSDIQYSNVDYYSVIADFRNYLRIAQRSAFASRFWIFYNDGRESRRFVMGGSWDLRGWPRWSIRGEKLWLTSQELRFPFLDQFALQFPFGGLTFSSIRGALFFDAGSAWDNVYTQTLGSIGAGLRLNLGGVLVLRYDMGKRIENNFTQFESDFFSQFFFGWDF
ncbi:MAG TPA: BamA/TamA family outer membrane protein [Bacteroidota bacterium]|nr:BamA/TamA family outer membrane protein [Bacteroidota bacterium]